MLSVVLSQSTKLHLMWESCVNVCGCLNTCRSFNECADVQDDKVVRAVCLNLTRCVLHFDGTAS